MAFEVKRLYERRRRDGEGDGWPPSSSPIRVWLGLGRETWSGPAAKRLYEKRLFEKRLYEKRGRGGGGGEEDLRLSADQLKEDARLDSAVDAIVDKLHNHPELSFRVPAQSSQVMRTRSRLECGRT